MADLIIFSGKMKGQRLILPDREVVVGRDESCHMRIASSLISRRHCTLKGTLNGVWVRDLDSQNGTYVNDVAINEPYLMKPGDVLRIGAALFQVPRLRPSQQKAANEGLSDDDITSWLTDDEQTQSGAAPDTTVIKGRQSANPAETVSADTLLPPDFPATPASPPPAPPVEVKSAPVIRQPPKTVKEQAAEIIRRHWELVRGQQPE
jgi:predicted component of type VI protein secretion system